MDPDTTLKQAVNAVTSRFGHAAPVLEIAAIVGWNARYEGKERQERLAEVARLLTEASEKLAVLEAEEEAERETEAR